jgi:hypothetical protein
MSSEKQATNSMNWAPRGRCAVTTRTVRQVRISTENSLEGRREKIQNSIKRPPKITKFESQLHNNTKKLFPKDLLQKINPSPPKK